MKTKATRKILLYGNSIILGSIGATLQRSSGFDITTLTTPLPDEKALDMLKPDIVLFDLDTSTTEPVFDLLKTNSELLLIGISPGVNIVRVWNSHQLREMSMQDLFKLLKSRATGVTRVHDASEIGRKAGSGQESGISV
jgi:hypothetical protein